MIIKNLFCILALTACSSTYTMDGGLLKNLLRARAHSSSEAALIAPQGATTVRQFCRPIKKSSSAATLVHTREQEERREYMPSSSTAPVRPQSQLQRGRSSTNIAQAQQHITKEQLEAWRLQLGSITALVHAVNRADEVAALTKKQHVVAQRSPLSPARHSAVQAVTESVDDLMLSSDSE